MELVFIRHGFSEWNAKNLFTGWRDVNLTERGIEEAKAAGKKIIRRWLRIRHRIHFCINTCNQNL